MSCHVRHTLSFCYLFTPENKGTSYNFPIFFLSFFHLLGLETHGNPLSCLFPPENTAKPSPSSDLPSFFHFVIFFYLKKQAHPIPLPSQICTTCEDYERCASCIFEKGQSKCLAECSSVTVNKVSSISALPSGEWESPTGRLGGVSGI